MAFEESISGRNLCDMPSTPLVVSTVCPRYNAPRYNVDSGITRSTVVPEN